ncbi:MAG: cytochrome C oxidase subunit IV family protein [Bryobacterales bacterium]|nr:cytochrome C oxidase subunit IV family protein [Bryobacterales bacterium]
MTATGLLVRIWVSLLVLTVVEVALAFQLLSPLLFLVVLLTLSFGKALLIMVYFMHLRLAPRMLSLALFPLLVFFVLLLFAFLPDAYRAGSMRVL